MAAAPERSRFRMVRAPSAMDDESFGDAVDAGLRHAPRSLPCRFLYDAIGSQLFEEICELPEYYPTRAERSILEERASEVADAFDEPVALVELGSGSATKTRLLLDALLARHGALHFVPIDVSGHMLAETARKLQAEYPRLDITAIEGVYGEGLRHLDEAVDERPRVVAWLGSSVGNLHRDEAAAFLGEIRSALRDRDRLVIGVDLRKEAAVLEAAYDDPRGVTARFNLNLLARIGRELGGQLDLDGFRHVARYDVERGVVELHLESLRAQRVTIRDLGLTVDLASGERIHTENSYKYWLEEISELAHAGGFSVDQSWTDADSLFSLNWLVPA